MNKRNENWIGKRNNEISFCSLKFVLDDIFLLKYIRKNTTILDLIFLDFKISFVEKKKKNFRKGKVKIV